MKPKQIEESEVLAVRLPKSLVAAVRKSSKENKCRQSEFIRTALYNLIEELKKQKGK